MSELVWPVDDLCAPGEAAPELRYSGADLRREDLGPLVQRIVGQWVTLLHRRGEDTRGVTGEWAWEVVGYYSISKYPFTGEVRRSCTAHIPSDPKHRVHGTVVIESPRLRNTALYRVLYADFYQGELHGICSMLERSRKRPESTVRWSYRFDRGRLVVPNHRCIKSAAKKGK